MMKIKPRKTLLENITFMAMMAAINIIFSVFAAFFPLAGLFIILFLPLVSALVGSSCRGRYLLIYIVGTLGLSIAATAWNFSNTIFYLLPSVLTGTLYGFLSKKGLPNAYCLFVVSILGIGLTYLGLAIVRLIYEIDMVATLFSLVGIKITEAISAGVPSLVFVYSLCSSGLASVIMNIVPIEFEKERIIAPEWLDFFFMLLGFICFGIIWIFLYFYLAISYLFLFFLLYISVYSASILFPFDKANRWAYISSSSLLIIGFVGFAALYRNLPYPTGLLGLSIPMMGVLIVVFIYNLLLRRKTSKSRINGQKEEQ